MPARRNTVQAGLNVRRQVEMNKRMNDIIREVVVFI